MANRKTLKSPWLPQIVTTMKKRLSPSYLTNKATTDAHRERTVLFAQIIFPRRKRTAVAAGPDQVAALLLECARLPLPELLMCFDTTAAGLPKTEVDDRLALFGPNEIAHERPPT